MAIKTQKDIEQELIQKFGAYQNKITDFSIGSIARGLLTAIASTIAEIWNELTQNRRRLFWDTAKGTDLEHLGDEIGITRLGAYFAATIAVFKSDEIQLGVSTSVGVGFLTDTGQAWTVNDFINGEWVLIDSAGVERVITSNNATTVFVTGTPAAGAYYVMPVVPAGTVIKSSITSLGYATQERVVVGKQNPGLLGQTTAIYFGNRTIVVCQVAGTAGAAQSNTITVISPAINGITSVTNPVPTQPRVLDAETDDQFRARAKTLINLLNQGTQAFFEALAVQADADVFRVVAQKDVTVLDGVKLYIATRSGGALSGGELTAIQTYVQNRCRAFDVVSAENMKMTDIFISFTASIDTTLSLDEVYVKIADAIANLIDYGNWSFDKQLKDDDVLIEILKVPEVLDVELATLSVQATKDGNPAGSKTITFVNSLPRFARLAVTNDKTSDVKDLVLQQLTETLTYKLFAA